MHNDSGEYEISITEHVARHAKTLSRKDLKKKFLGDDYESDDEVELSEEEKERCIKEKSDASKAQGTENFKAGKYEEAITLYKQAGDYMARLHSSGEAHDVKSARDEFQISCFLNIAMCNLKLADKAKEEGAKAVLCNKAKDSATQAIELKPTVKAYFRRATACSRTKDWDQGIADMKLALEIDPEDKACQQLMNNCAAWKKAAKDKEKAGYAKMFG